MLDVVTKNLSCFSIAAFRRRSSVQFSDFLVTGAGPVVFRSRDIEDALVANFSPAALMRISIAPSGLNSDIHADSEYRAHLVVVMARRAVEQALMGQGLL